ncbi:uncharacterized protein [Henckelia pumila]|uniref:uncharacterized protein isoform X2 n=1 Tax=Henckelia pumila TaxID=405737 RepID=UPI003C6E7DD4
MKRNLEDVASGRGSASVSDVRAHRNVVEFEPEEILSDGFSIQEEMEELNTSREIGNGEESPSKRPKRKATERRAKNMYGSERGEMMGNLTKSALFDTFEDYKKLYVSTNRTSTSSMSSSSMEMRGIASGDSNDTDSERVFVRSHRKKYQQMISEIGGMDESELDMYLHERIEKDYPKFDVLDWWKVHSPRFPILSRLARDVLAMPISTVASESVFSTGGRIIDDFKASLTPKMAQSLICCQDWLRHNPMKSSEEDYDFIQNIERGEGMISTGAAEQ